MKTILISLALGLILVGKDLYRWGVWYITVRLWTRRHFNAPSPGIWYAMKPKRKSPT